MVWTQKTKSSPSGSEKRAAKSKSKAKKTNSGRAGSGGVNSPASRVAARVRATPKATQTSQSNKATRRVATPIKSKAVTYANTDNKIVTSSTPVAKAKITQPQVEEERPSGTLKDGLVGPASTNNVLAINNTAQYKTSQDPKLLGEMGVETRQPVNTGEVSQFNERGRTPVKTPMTPKPLEQGSISLGSGPEAANKRAIDLQKAYQEPVPRANFDQATYGSEVKSNKDSTIPSVLLSAIKNDKYRNDEVSYNQAYYKARRAGGATQAELAAEQKSIGSKKMYSGDRVITKEDQARSKYILAGIERTGVTPTVTSEKSGFFDEMTTTKSSYDIGTGKPVTTTTQEYKPNILGVQLGDNITKTFVNGVATNIKTGDGDAKTSDLGSLKQRSQSSQDPIAEIKALDNQIANETDPVKLKAAHKRRLMLMRMNQTNTKFAGLLGDADTKRTKLMSIA